MMKQESDFRTPTDGEATLSLPRFDESEARAASPVVPLSEVRAGRAAQAFGAVKSWHGWHSRNFRRSWPLALLLLGVFAAGVVGSAVFYQQRDARVASDSSDSEASGARPAPEAPSAPRDSDAASAPARKDARPDSTRERRDTRRAETLPDDAGFRVNEAAALAGFALGGFAGEGSAGDDDGDKDGDKKERKRKRRARRDDYRRHSRSGSSSGGARLVGVLRHD